MEIRRDKYLDILIHSCGNGLIKVITGMRRSGKSYLLFTLFKNYLIKQGVKEDHIIGVNLENRLNKSLRDITSIHRQTPFIRRSILCYAG